jgi:hypothetical protein
MTPLEILEKGWPMAQNSSHHRAPYTDDTSVAQCCTSGPCAHGNGTSVTPARTLSRPHASASIAASLPNHPRQQNRGACGPEATR